MTRLATNGNLEWRDVTSDGKVKYSKRGGSVFVNVNGFALRSDSAYQNLGNLPEEARPAITQYLQVGSLTGDVAYICIQDYGDILWRSSTDTQMFDCVSFPTG